MLKNTVNKKFAINEDQLSTFSTLFEIAVLDGTFATRKSNITLTKLETPSGEKIVLVEMYKIEENDLNRLLSKLNKYGVKVA